MAEQAAHIRKAYEQELKRLRDMITEMGGLVENEVSLATEAVLERDPTAATGALENEPRVNALEREAEQFVIRMLALRQPVADDLRHIFAALKIAGDLERIGDYASNVAKRSMVLNQYQVPFSFSGLAHIAQLVQENLKNVIDAFGENDASKAMDVWRSDEDIDGVYNAIFRELITYMMEDPRNITPCAHLLFIAKNLERMGDHATNIAETVYYAVLGQPLTDERPKGDSTPYAVVRPPAN